MRKTKKHLLITKLYAKHIKAVNECIDAINTLPNAGEYCNCGDKLEMGYMDFDIDYGTHTATVVCMTCGGFVIP